jgi:hypothetical protein
MPVTILAIGTSDSADGGAILTFAFPVALFVVVAVILYLLFSRPHRRIPERRVLVPADAAAPGADAARAAAVAAGMPTAAGGGGAESGAEPAGAARESAADDGPSNVAGRDDARAEAGGPDQEAPTADGTEAGE